LIQAGAHKDAALEDAISPLLAAVGDVDLARYDASDDAQHFFQCSPFSGGSRCGRRSSQQ